MKFDNHFIDQIRNSISIVDLIGGYVHLKQSGTNQAALCPFHNERTPSFLASESKQIFKCFGCGAGGDIFKFVMLIENLTFPEAVHHLAERNGIAIPQSGKDAGLKTEKRRNLLGIMEVAVDFYRRCLTYRQNAPEVMGYLRNRGIEISTIEGFGIGFAPAGNQLLDLLKQRGYSVEQALACGLIGENQSGQYYDKFRNRIMFPIRGLSGRPIAFGGRIWGDGVPKYLNSPETLLYNKSSNLYALDLSRDEIRRRDFAVLVEGYFDCAVPYQFGMRNIVASLGTSLTQDQVKILGRYTRNIIISYDPDSAGIAATMRSIDLFLEQGFRVNIAELPHGQDPDALIRAEGIAAYQERIKSSLPYLDFALSRFIDDQRDPFSPKGKQEIISHIVPYVLKIPHKIERAEYVSRIAARLHLDEDLIMSEMRKSPRTRERPTAITVPSILNQLTPAEETLLVSMLHQQFKSPDSDLPEPELFEGLRSEQIFRAILELKQQNQEITIINLRKLLEDHNDLDLLETLAFRSSRFLLSEEMIRKSIWALRRKQCERLSRQIQEEINQESKRHSMSSKIDELLVQKETIRKKWSSI